MAGSAGSLATDRFSDLIPVLVDLAAERDAYLVLRFEERGQRFHSLGDEDAIAPILQHEPRHGRPNRIRIA